MFTNAQIGGEVLHDHHGEQPQVHLREKVIVAGGAPFTPLSMQLPPRCRVIWSNLRNIQALTVVGNDHTSTVTNTANSFALVYQLSSSALTSPTTGSHATNGTTVVPISIQNATAQTAAAGSIQIGPGTNAANAIVNTSSNPGYLFIVPSASAATNFTSQIATSGALFNIVSSNTTGFKFYSTTTNATNATSNTSAVCVSLRLQYFGDVPNS